MATPVSISDIPPNLLVPIHFSTSILKSSPSHNVTVIIYPSPIIPPKLPSLLLPFINRAYTSPLFPGPDARYLNTDEYQQELKSHGDIAWIFVVFIHTPDVEIPLDLEGINLEAVTKPRNGVTLEDKLRVAATLILKIGAESQDLVTEEAGNALDEVAVAKGGIVHGLDPFDTLFLQGLSVDIDLHGHGVGSFLMKEMERFIVNDLHMSIPTSLTPVGGAGNNNSKRVRKLHAHMIREVASNEAFYMKRGYVLQSVHKLPKGTWGSLGEFHLLMTVKDIEIPVA